MDKRFESALRNDLYEITTRQVRKDDTKAAIKVAISNMIIEEVCYWSAKCQYPHGRRAFRVLFGG